MTTNLICQSPIEGLVLRIVKLNSCGVPVTGSDGASIVMDGFTEVTSSPQYDTGDRVITRKANGTLCQNFKIPDQYTNDEVTMNFCVWNPGLIPLTINGDLITATSSPTGTGFSRGTVDNVLMSHFSLEVWQAPPQSCDATGIVYYPYHAWPHLGDGKIGDFAINLDATILQIMANTYDGSPLWTVGNDYIGAASLEQGKHYYYNLDSSTPPPSACLLAGYP